MKKLFTLFTKLNTNSLVAGSALFISACALFLSVQEVRIMRTQQKATMYPYLTVGWRYNSDGFGLVLKNSGNGLAKINSYKVFNDSIYFREWLDLISTYMPEAKTLNYSNLETAGNIRNQMIAPGETVPLIFMGWNDESRELQSRLSEESIQVSLCYESLLGENWVIEKGIPRQIEQPCKISLEEEFGF